MAASQPSSRRPLSDEVVARHAEAVRRGEPVYVDPVSGLSVFTAAFHLSRGSCCDSSCRHCPYRDA